MRDFIDLSADAARPVLVDPSAVTLVEVSQDGHLLTVHHAKGGCTRVANTDVPFDAVTVAHRLHGAEFVACGENAVVSLRDVYFIARGKLVENTRSLHLGLRQQGSVEIAMPAAEAEALVARLCRVKTMHSLPVREVSGRAVDDCKLMVQSAALRYARPTMYNDIEIVLGTQCQATIVPADEVEGACASFNAACAAECNAVDKLVGRLRFLCEHLDALKTSKGTVLVSRQDVQMVRPQGDKVLSLQLGGVDADGGSLSLTLGFDDMTARTKALYALQHAQSDEDRMILRQSCR